MSYTIEHPFGGKILTVSVTTANRISTASCSAELSIPINFPGGLVIEKSATYLDHAFIPDLDVNAPAGAGKFETSSQQIPLTVEIIMPDGNTFGGTQITFNELGRFRDLRGAIVPELWTIKVHGELSIELEKSQTITAGKGHFRVTILEEVNSKSAPPLVSDFVPNGDRKLFNFDLYRVGNFTATVKSSRGLNTQRVMTLLNPDGVAVATSDNGILTFPVTLRVLDQSRNLDRTPRSWSLEVLPSAASNLENESVFATIFETERINASVIQERIKFLLGDHGSKISLSGEEKDSKLLCRLMILDEISAATVDMYRLLEDIINKSTQDGGVTTDVVPNVAYTIGSISKDVIGHGTHLSLDGMKISTLDISVGASVKIQRAIPAIKVKLTVEGQVLVKIGSFSLAEAKVRNNSIEIETGLLLNSDGTFSIEILGIDNLMDIDLHWEAALAAGVLSGGLILLGLEGFTELIEPELNKRISTGITLFFRSILSKIPYILAIVLGDDFTYTDLTLEGNDILFKYIAPIEPEPKPSEGYHGIIGRSFSQLGPGQLRITPAFIGDTWKAENLAKNINHIVVVVMENRSFDHVLGYLQTSDGLTPDLISFLESNDFSIKKLRDSKIKENQVHLKTRFPVSVGHELEDVREQLSEKLITPLNRSINSPVGFVSNFKKKADKHNAAVGFTEVSEQDVLGFYDDKDLEFYSFLVQNYSYCDKFFCSHPGPTLPNRMFTLTGDLQYDRYGQPILDNNNSDNFYLSRATTILDLLTRKGVNWRVYESFPSFTMLRLFARYASDVTNIVDIKRLQQDVAAGDIPALTIIDPAMHHAPENDDHSPFADMYNGQLFLKGIYDTLTSNKALWQRTMLIITYDEHGGFYDHVIPPTADFLTRPPVLDGGFGGTGNLTPSSMAVNYGLRVPTFVVSPWATPGKGPEIVLDFCSILKTILLRFCGNDKPFLSNRVNVSRSFEAYLSSPEARMNVPASPAMSPLSTVASLAATGIKTAPVFRRDMRKGSVDYHDLTGMVARMFGR